MASRGKKKTTMAKLNRETKLAEKRYAKQMRKDQRKAEATTQPGGGPPIGEPLPPLLTDEELANFEPAA